MTYLDQIVQSTPDDVDVRILCRNGNDGHGYILLNRDGQRVGGLLVGMVNEFILNHGVRGSYSNVFLGGNQLPCQSLIGVYASNSFACT